MVRINVKIDLTGVNRKLGPSNIRVGRYYMTQQILGDMSYFVPADQYTLRQTGHMAANGEELIWQTPYARPQFYGMNGKVAFYDYTTPGTGKRWDLKAKRMYSKFWGSTFVKGAGLN